MRKVVPDRTHATHLAKLRCCLAVAAGIPALVACRDAGVPSPDPRMPVVRAALIQPATAELTRYAVVALDWAGPIKVEYWTAGAPRLQVSADSDATEHRVLLARLFDGATYQYEVYPLDAVGRRGAPAAGSFSTAPLPAGLASLRSSSTGQPSYPLTMFEIGQPGFAGFVVVDGRGRIVWYWQTAGGATGAARRQNGNFVFLDTGRGLVEVSPDGRVVTELPQGVGGRGFHHDLIVSAGNTVYAIANDLRADGDSMLTGEAIWEWDPDHGTAAKRWSAFDFLPPSINRGPRSRATDWLHANSLAVGPRGNILISLHFLNQIVSIQPDFAALEWRLGGVGADITVANDPGFSGQHTAAEVAPGHVLMFDNGVDRVAAPRYSRALELQLDLATRTARPVWSFRAEPDNYAGAISSARRLPGGNTVVQFGTGAGVIGSTGPVEAYEVTPSGAVTWHVRFDDLRVSFRATPLPSLAGEVEVPGPGS